MLTDTRPPRRPAAAAAIARPAWCAGRGPAATTAAPVVRARSTSAAAAEAKGLRSMMADWLDNLPTLYDDGLPAVLEVDTEAARLAGIKLASRKRHARRVRARRASEQLRVANAAAALEALPELGESLHVIMAGNFNAFDLVLAILRLAAPATILELNCATLGTNTRNTAILVDLLDTGQVHRCSFICSAYFKAMKDGGQIYAHLHQVLRERGMPCTAIRSHAKIILAELTDGRCFTIESSANLRSCRNIEQFVMSHDRPLLLFHRAWMQEVLRG